MIDNQKPDMEEVYQAVLGLKKSVTYLRDQAERFHAEGGVTESEVQDAFIDQMIALHQADKIVEMLETFE